ncbi:ester cyclase [Rugosimonospora acidiphila]|uniref:Ester cyclase n=1 Tax=Rugosimonospora acidiphila TaxID=556531 RepID=A0ABP9RKG9_9ACTN
MSTEDNKALVRRYIETWNRGDLPGMAEFWSPDMVHHTRMGSHGFNAVLNIVSGFMTAFPDLQFEIVDLVADGDRVASRMIARATHTGEYMGMPATGKPVECSVFGIARVAGGKLVEHWGVTDELHLMQQVGLLPEAVLAAMG